MGHTSREGKIFITYVLDGGSGDVITPANFHIDQFVWNPVNTTDKLIVREYISWKAKSEMPELPIYLGNNTTTSFKLTTSVQLLIDYAASTTPANNVITLIGKWEG